MATSIFILIHGQTCKRHGVNPDAFRESLLQLELLGEAKIEVDFGTTGTTSPESDYSGSSAVSKINFEGDSKELAALNAAVRHTFTQQIQARWKHSSRLG
jgi:hypothetical protein